MTCIVGVKQGKKVFIGADSAGVSGLNVTVRKDAKVFKNGKFVIGCTSSFRMIQLLRFSFKPPKRKGKEIYEYMCTDFVDAIRECFEKGGYLQKFKDGDEKGGTFLVGYKNRLFKICVDFQVAESHDDFDATGCGEPFALGSLETTQDLYLGVNQGCYMNPEDRILLALGIAAKRSGGVCPPFLIEKT